MTCPDCGHVHASPALGSICIGCPCLSVPAFVGRASMPPVPVELLPLPRLIVWHGEPGDDPATDNALAVLRRTYYGVMSHGTVPGARTAGGNDWTGWHFPDPEAVGGLADVALAIAPSHWVITG